jgi:predicted small lipoprotein YifL
MGCGIKGPPVPDKETIIPSYIDQHTESSEE